jgi:hypothetical protein
LPLNEGLKVDEVIAVQIWKKRIVNEGLKLLYRRFDLNGSQLGIKQPCE